MRDGAGALPFSDFQLRHLRVVDHRFDYVIEFACHVTFFLVAVDAVHSLYYRFARCIIANESLCHRC